MERIPLVDLRSQYLAHRTEFDETLQRCISQTSFIGGPDHEAFSKEFAEFCGGGSVSLCGNGTDALFLALISLLGRGDYSGEVITVSNTFIATSEAITQAGYRPVFVDVDPETLLMDVTRVEQAITPKTKAIIPVHLFGQMVPMDALMEIAQRHGLYVLEDAAQAHGSAWMGKGPGQWGDVACFSFYPGKNLGAWGDGGAVFTRDQHLAKRIKMWANHGRLDKYRHEFEGVNSRLDGLQAAILRVKLPYLTAWNEARRQAAAWYDELLAGISGVTRLKTASQAQHVFHLYVVQVDYRDAVLDGLKAHGIEAGVHYPIPLHEQPAYSHLGIPPQALPVTHAAAGRILSLPLFPEITRAQVSRVVETLRAQLGPRE